MKQRIRITPFLLLCVVLAVSAFSGCSDERQPQVDLLIGQSTRYSEQEIRKAMDTVLNEFDSEEYGCCTLKSLEYDEKKSDDAAALYLAGGNGAQNGATEENTIVLFSDFDVDDNPTGAWEADTHYDWQYILIRSSKGDAWKIDDRGY